MEKKKNWQIIRSFIPVAIIVFLMALIYFLGLHKYFYLETIKLKYMDLRNFVSQNPFTSPLIFIGVYILITALSIPVALILSLIGGFLFYQPWSTLYVVLGGTVGATLLFLAARTSLKSFLHEKTKKKHSRWLSKIEEGFAENGANYLLFLRLVPLLPFWLVNLAPAFLNVSIFTYIWTTFIGIIPGSFVYTQAGRGLGAILEKGDGFSLDVIFNTQLVIALVCLAIFSLLPIFIKKWMKKK
ncbi:MAG: VTT domain-containing protein [Chlamydiae bacterium]|nr:VTT domain-containing protein [Chlamydiota bacterium]